MENISIISIVISVLVPMIMGMIWYSKALFGKAWMDSIGKTEEQLKEASMGKILGIALFLSLIITAFMFMNCNGPGQEGDLGEFDTFKHGAAHGLFVSILLVTPIFITNGLFERKSWTNMIINVTYWIITLTIVGAVLDGMNHMPNVMP